MKISKILYAAAVLSCVVGILAMFAAKVAAYEGGVFLLRTELHWFNDSISVFLLSINLLAFVLLTKKM